MYKLLVVEDEYVIRKGIIDSIDWPEIGFCVVGDAANGREGIKCVEETQPDVILTDVRMPVMDGLAMAETILRKYPDIKIIILSGFADFEYAQQAIRFRVFDYLLKPTNKDRVIQCFLRLKAKIDAERSEVMRHLDMQSKMYEGLLKLREDFFGRAFHQELAMGRLLQDRLDYLEVDMSGEMFAVGIIKLEFDSSIIEDAWQSDHKLLRFSYYNILNELLGDGEYGVPVVLSIKEIAVVFNFKDVPFTQRAAADIMDAGAKALVELMGDNSTRVSCGLGQGFAYFSMLKDAFEQVQSVVDKAFFDAGSHCRIYHETPENSMKQKKRLEHYPALSDQIVDETLAGNTARVEILIADMFSAFRKANLTSGDVMDYAYNLCFKLFADFSVLSISDDKDTSLPEESYKEEIYGMATSDALESYIMALFRRTSEAFFAKKSDSTDNIIDCVKQYIQKNYASDISLEMLSKKMFISSSYLSYMFKNTTGQSYSSYLKNLRLGKARELLQNNNDLKVYEVCYMVGYKEYKYFSQQFKKAFGTSPTEIRKRDCEETMAQ
jgi:two-component system response regulator YesN